MASRQSGKPCESHCLAEVYDLLKSSIVSLLYRQRTGKRLTLPENTDCIRWTVSSDNLRRSSLPKHPVNEWMVRTGRSHGFIEEYHRYLNVIGGFLSVTVERVDGKPNIVFRHHDVEGRLRYVDRLK